MELHHQLQSLVQQRGEAVLADPDVLRAALEDYLDEQTASTGDLNLLVDAVRLGGLARLRSASEGGAPPAAAVETAGDYLARQRGSSDATSAQWACGALGYAVGMVPEHVPSNLRRTMSGGATPGYPPAGGPVMSPAPMMSPPATSPVQQPWQAGQQTGPATAPQGWAGGPAGGPYGQPPKKSKAPLIAIGAAVLLLAVGGGIGLAISASGDDDGEADDKPTTSQSGDPTDGPTSNGGDEGDGELITDMELEAVQAAVVADMNALTSVNMAGMLEQDGEEMRLDISFDTDGRCTGAIQMQGGTASIISDGKDEYLRGDEAFWIASNDGVSPGQEILDMFVGTWIKSSGTEQFASFCDLNNLLEAFDNDGAVDFEISGTTVVNGREAAELSVDDGSKIFVGNEGPHHILRMINEGTEPGEFTFSRFNEPLDIKTPTDFIDSPGG